jgi:phosphopantetheine adenylyltransferase
MAIFSKFAKGHAKQIAKAQKWIDNAQATFASAIEEAEIAERKFDEVVADAQAKMEELQKTLDETNARKEQAVKFKQKIQSFLD